MYRAIPIHLLLFFICVLQFATSGYAADPEQAPNPGQVADPVHTASPAQTTTPPQADNTTQIPNHPKMDARGIAVGAPKAFDNRTLNLMLERLNRQLAGINVIDQNALAKAIGAVQGSRIQETSRSFVQKAHSCRLLECVLSVRRGN